MVHTVIENSFKTYAPINAKPRGGGGGGRPNHRVLTVRSVPRLGILSIRDIPRVGNLT